MPTVDLVYDADCPNIATARANLLHAFSRVGITPSWSEHVIGDPSAPGRVRGYGSPTILVDGRDVAGLAPAAELCCRVYAGPTGFSGAPGTEQIAQALSRSAKQAASRTARSGWRSSLAAVPGVGFALLPKVACPDGPGEFRADYKTSSEFFTLMTGAKEGLSPHGIQQTWYSSNIKELIEQESFTAPEGTVAIKEFDMDKDGALDGLAVMIKRAPGFDADNGDWYYDMRSLDGQVMPSRVPAQIPCASVAIRAMQRLITLEPPR